MFTKVIVNKAAAAAMAVFTGAFLLAGVSLFAVGSVIGGGICLVISLLYGYMAAVYGAVVRVDAQGISRKVFFLPAEHHSWEEIREVGVYGSRVVKAKSSGRVGTLYLYFSPEAMTEDERFGMVLRWPVRQIHFVFNRRSLEIVQYFWDREIVTFNTGSFRI